MQCLILAGGLGSRIASVAKDLPKTLIPVAGRPFAFMQLEWLARNGVSDVVYCIGHKGEQIRDAVGNGHKFNLNVQYCDEGDTLLGTGGAIRLACSEGLMQDGFFVLYGDSWLPIELAPVWVASAGGTAPCMTVLHNKNQWDKSNIEFVDGRVLRYDKTVLDPLAEGIEYIDYGISVFPRDLIEQYIESDTVYDLAKLMSKLTGEGEMRGFEVNVRFYEIGTPSGLAALEAHLAS